MLKDGARRRVKEALEPQLRPGETLVSSAFSWSPGRGDYAIGLTQDRLILVRVGKLSGRPRGEVVTYGSATLTARVGRLGVMFFLTPQRSGEVWRFWTEPMWGPQLTEIVEALRET